MARPGTRIGFIQFCLFLGALAVLGRSAQLQLVRGGRYAAEVQRARTVREVLQAPRGTIYDRSGAALAVTQESYHVSIAPEAVKDRRGLLRALARVTGESLRELEQRFRRARRSDYFPGPYNALEVEPIRGLPGVHLEVVLERIRPMGSVAQHAVGIIDEEKAAGLSGLEAVLDSVLAGVPGEAVRVRDNRGQRYESPSRLVRSPVRGNDVVLTIDARLQQIAEAALDEAVDRMEARGGNVVFLDPNTGELLAVASRERGGKSAAWAFTEPFEPGSTAKLFTAAALLMRGRVSAADRVSGERGRWEFTTPRGAVYLITDTHGAQEPLTLEASIGRSSNIGMAKFVQRLTPGELYETLRDFGFGTRTGVEVSAESPGYFERPEDWEDGYGRESLSRGYYFSVTALQLASAYAAIANGGILFAPTLVKEIRAPDGAVLYRHQPEPVRRVVSDSVASTLRRFLRTAVGSTGTGERAQIQQYALVGKTGTARKVENRRYVNKYVSSFAAIWPAERPQVVAIVTIDEPRGGYYGGETAAPLARSMIEEALLSRNSALDFARLAHRDSTSRVALGGVHASAETPRETVSTVPWPIGPATTRRDTLVPDVTGLHLRAAARALHRAGFRVGIRGSGVVVRTEPQGGSGAGRGKTVLLFAEPPRLN